MKIERFEDLIEWTRRTHASLSTCLARGADQRVESLAKMLLVYLSEHEKVLANTIAQIEKHADRKALNTWVYDYVSRDELTLRASCSQPYAEMTADEIARDIFNIHNQIIDLYRSLARRAEIEKARELLDDLLQLEHHEAMRLAHQVGRLNEM